jgi:hypothetical protein
MSPRTTREAVYRLMMMSNGVAVFVPKDHQDALRHSTERIVNLMLEDLDSVAAQALVDEVVKELNEMYDVHELMHSKPAGNA